MAHFAELNESNMVIRMIVVNNVELLDENGHESEQKGIDFCVAHYGGRWIQTSYNRNFRKNYCGIGFLYDSNRDAFIAPKPFSSWTFNEETCKWEPPTPFPIDEQSRHYYWHEESLTWQLNQ